MPTMISAFQKQARSIRIALSGEHIEKYEKHLIHVLKESKPMFSGRISIDAVMTENPGTERRMRAPGNQ